MTTRPLSLSSLVLVFGCEDARPIHVNRSEREVVFHREGTFIKANSVENFIPSMQGQYQLFVRPDQSTQVVIA